MATKKQPKTTRISYQDWMKLVDRILALDLFGLTSSDLLDMDYRSWYEDGLTPQAAAHRAMKESEAY